MLFDPTRQQLLLTLHSGSSHAQPVLVNATSLTLLPLGKPVRLALWLAAG